MEIASNRSRFCAVDAGASRLAANRPLSDPPATSEPHLSDMSDNEERWTARLMA
jgi:hypothetical protein